ncbi:RNA methyltransferase [Thiorhodospira sibirica]|uniref:RNA methyltransferase n=1 Tax=Thiorhodospira sibirica TaxID=154347 RepID=UPI00022C1D41|nr:RNA methyltransferase [Thiorhodospira sibirica]
MPLTHVQIVLSHTSHPGNIGAVARAMKTMGLGTLKLVQPKHHPSAEALAMASGADDVLQQAQVYQNLSEALAQTHWVIGTSARLRSLRWPQLSPRQAAAQLLEQASHGPVALLFGRERIGLTNAELDQCQALVNIPANPHYPSLNLAAAVQILAYELRLAADAQPSAATATAPLPDDEQPASQQQLEDFYQALEHTLIAIDFLDPQNPKHLMRRLRRLYGRQPPLSVKEINILRGILTQTLRTKNRAI